MTGRIQKRRAVINKGPTIQTQKGGFASACSFFFFCLKKEKVLLFLGLVSFTSMSNQEHRAVYYSSSNLATNHKAKKAEPKMKPENGF